MSDVFTEEQVAAVLDSLGIEIVGDTEDNFVCFCPFHGNRHTPAFSISKEEGVFLCFNAACDSRGNIRQLIKSLTNKNDFQTDLFLLRIKKDKEAGVAKYLEKKLTPVEFPKYPASRVRAEHEALWNSQDALHYMRVERKFSDATLKEFMVGYNEEKNIITVPMFDAQGDPIGCIGRGVGEKVFKNSVGLPKRATLFNIHNAKRKTHTVILEASFDAMRCWQATGIHAVATLGSYIGDGQADQLNKYFSSIVLAPDDDQTMDYKQHCRRCRREGNEECMGHNTGFELGKEISSVTPGITVTWAHLNSLKRYDGMKDFGDMSDEEIQYAVENAISNYEMMRRGA